MIIWLASYPRSGNTFLRIILNRLFDIPTYSIYNDTADIGADPQTSKIVGHKRLPENFDLNEARESDDIFTIKTHELPDKHYNSRDRVIYLVRDGRACSLSLVGHQHHFGRHDTTIADVINGYVFGGTWGDHVSAWSPKTRHDCLLVRFENIVMQDKSQLQSIADYLGLESTKEVLPTFDELQTINPKFFRTGKNDLWKQSLTPEEHALFWLNNGTQMKEYGYTEDMPDVFSSDNGTQLFRALSYQNRYMVNKLLSIENLHQSKINKQLITQQQILADLGENIGNQRETAIRHFGKLGNLIENIIADQQQMASILSEQKSRAVSLENSVRLLRDRSVNQQPVTKSTTAGSKTGAGNSGRNKPVIRQPTMQYSLNILRDCGVDVGTVLDVGVLAITQPLVDVFPDKTHHLFEPVESHFDAIRKNYKKLNHILHNAAISDLDGELFLACTSINNDGNISHSQVMEKEVTKDEIPNLVTCKKIRRARLDTIMKTAAAKPPYLLKIDVDGHEISVLKGAEETLRNTSIVVMEAPLDRGSLPKFFERGLYLLEREFYLMDIVDLSYYDDILWQADLVFVHKDIALTIDRLRPFQADSFSFEGQKWYALNKQKFI